MSFNYLKKYGLSVFLIALLSLFVVCEGNQRIAATGLSNSESALIMLLKKADIPEYHFQVINTYPHDKHSFTEGFLLDDGYLYESTGLNGKSTLRKIEPNTGKIIREYRLPYHYFAEGISVLDDKIYQLTYRSKVCFVYDKNTFALQKTFSYAGEGWGLTTDGKELIMSNGSAILSFIDPKTFTKTHSLTVMVQNKKISSLNELEYIDNKIYANVWPTSIVLIISSQTARVEGWLNIKSLKPNFCGSPECVANGIAYEKTDNTLLVTGKYWPYVYSIKLESSLQKELPRP